jgi:hypothetical protein
LAIPNQRSKLLERRQGFFDEEWIALRSFYDLAPQGHGAPTRAYKGVYDSSSVSRL